MMKQDKMIRATGKTAEFRFVVVEATETVQQICTQHEVDGSLAILVSDAILGSLLLASGLKNPGALQLTQRYKGFPHRVSADATPEGLVRAMVPHQRDNYLLSKEWLPELLSVRKLNSEGTLISEGLVQAPSNQLTTNLIAYLWQSEQIKSALGLYSLLDNNSKSILSAFGFWVEAFPKAKESEIQLLESNIKLLPSLPEQAYAPEEKLTAWLKCLAQGMEVQIHKEMSVQFYCPCNEEKVRTALKSLGKNQLEELLREKETLELHCDFCRKYYEVGSAFF